MEKGKFLQGASASAKKRNYRLVALILALVLVAGGVVRGTVAWLIDTTSEVKNTFTYGDINIKLDETDPETKQREEEGNEYQMIPGEDITKDPKVTVLKDSENCWLFVKLVKSENFDSFLTYSIGDGWTQLYDADNKVEGVYYRVQGETTEDDVVYSVLKDDVVSVLGTVTKDMLNELDDNGQNATNPTYPSLSVTAYAVQYSSFEPKIDAEATEPNAKQINDAAWRAWNAVEEQKSSANP